MTPIVVTVGPLSGASADNIATSQTPNKGPLTLNGSTVTNGVAVLDHPRQVLITTTDSTHSFTITGTDWAGSPISESVTGNGTTGTSVLSYATVSSIVISGNASAAVTVGTNGVAYSPWIRFDGFADPVVSKTCVAAGTVNYTVQMSYDDPNSPGNPVNPNAMTWVSDSDTNFVNATATKQGAWAYAPVWARILLNSGSGSVTGTFLQTGVAPY